MSIRPPIAARRGATVPLVAFAIALAGCHDPASQENGPPRSQFRDIDELQRLQRTPVSCDATEDCPTGSHCDDESGRCRFDCVSHQQCDEGTICSPDGACVPGVSARATDDPTCAGLTRAQLLAGLDELRARPLPLQCADDSMCPCGAFCGPTGSCAVECFTDNPPPEYTCGSGESCTPMGRCVATPPSGDPEDPTYELDIHLSPVLVSANTAGGPRVEPVTVVVEATSLAALEPVHQATVLFSFPVVDMEEPGDPPPPRPRVKCDPDDELADTCELAGGWIFNAGATFRSQPRTIWVEIPQTTAETNWWLRAASDYANGAPTISIQSAPLPIPATDPGSYRGTLVVPNEGAPTSSPNATLSFPIDAFVTADHIAILEPSAVVFPAGHAVVSRDLAKSTRVSWLSSVVTNTAASYDVRVELVSRAYTPSTGHLDVTLRLTTGIGDTPRMLDLSLDRVARPSPDTCTADSQCDDGDHCEIASGMRVCLPGPVPGGTVVTTATDSPLSTSLPSAQWAAWAAVLPGLRNGDPTRLGATGERGVEQAYCYESPSQPGPSHLGFIDALLAPSLDRPCSRVAGSPLGSYAQPTFPFFHRTRELELDGNDVTTFDLFERCSAELGHTPATPSSLGSRDCVSLARFFLAMDANVVNGVGRPSNVSGQRVVHGIVRQWLALNAYAAATAVQVRAYKDAFDGATQPAYQHLGQTVDRVEANLRLLLDPALRGQLRQAAEAGTAFAAADYRQVRPLAYWSFNDAGAPGNSPDGNVTLRPLAGAPFAQNKVIAGAGRIITSLPSTLARLANRTDYSLVVDLQFALFEPTSASTSLLVLRNGPNDKLELSGKVSNPGTATQQLTLTLSGLAGSVMFPPIAASGPAGHWGLVAIVASGPSFQLYHRLPGATATSVVTGTLTGTVMYPDGPAELAIENNPAFPPACYSWDRYLPGDKLGSYWPFPMPQTRSYWHTCYASGCTVPALKCNDWLTAQRNYWLGELVGAPQAALDGLVVTSEQRYINQGPIAVYDDHLGRMTYEFEYSCQFTGHNYPIPSYEPKAICASQTLARTDAGMQYDELSIWDRPLPLDEFDAMVARRATSGVTVPPPGTEPALANAEQSVALPVHVVSAAAAQLDLLTEYISAERGQMYAECSDDGGIGYEARDRVLARAGRNLRLAGLLESEARQMASLPGAPSAPWYPRYVDAQTILAASRSQALDGLARARACDNPLGIPADALALYIGEANSDAERFFASSRNIVKEAFFELDLARNKHEAAKIAFREQRSSIFQHELDQDMRNDRVARLKADYESTLIRACGAPAGTRTLLDRFFEGSLTSETCFFKTELAACAAAPMTPLLDVPAACLRGELGARMLAIQASAIDTRNAMRAFERAVETYDAKNQACIDLQEFHLGTQELRKAHATAMARLRSLGAGLGIAGDLLNLGMSVASGQYQRVPKSMLHAAGGVSFVLAGVQRSAEAEEAAFQQQLAERREELEWSQCFKEADQYRHGKDAAIDVIRRALHDRAISDQNLSDQVALVSSVVQEAAARIDIESNLVTAPPQFHFWLDPQISYYRRHLEAARRLTFLALRALEYESQSSLALLRRDVMGAAVPDDLQVILSYINSRTAPFADRWPKNTEPGVVSLVHDVLKITDDDHDMVPPERWRSAEQKFKEYLLSDSARMYDANHRYLGRGVRFTLQPPGIFATTCAERIWRITTSVSFVQIPDHHGVVLMQRNAFGSQACEGAPGEVLESRVEASTNLLVDDKVPAFTRRTPYAAMNVDGPPNLGYSDLALLPDSGPLGFSEAMAGRGIFGDYILLFPYDDELYTDEVIAEVTDVMIRFDFLEVTRPIDLPGFFLD